MMEVSVQGLDMGEYAQHRTGADLAGFTAKKGFSGLKDCLDPKRRSHPTPSNSLGMLGGFLFTSQRVLK